MEPARSHRNPAVVEAARLHRADERRKRGQTLLEGPHLVGEALAAGTPLLKVFALAGDEAGHRWAGEAKADLVVVGREGLERLSATRTPQSPVAVIDIPVGRLDPSRSVLVAWQISDPGNLGTMIRTAAAFRLDVAVSKGSVDPWSPKVLRAAAGAHFHTNLAEIDDPAEIDAVKVATVVEGGEPLGDLPAGRLALLIGSEAHGLPDHVVGAADMRVTIPMSGAIESLNAAVAAAILIYEATRRTADRAD
jgi:TrmH family RNA methyltransferase